MTKDKTVQELIDRGKNALISLYYRNEKITFVEDILQEIGITEDLRIEKPGSDVKLFESIKHEVFGFKRYGPSKPFKLETRKEKRSRQNNKP